MLQSYKFHIVHVVGKCNVLPDFLSINSLDISRSQLKWTTGSPFSRTETTTVKQTTHEFIRFRRKGDKTKRKVTEEYELECNFIWRSPSAVRAKQCARGHYPLYHNSTLARHPGKDTTLMAMPMPRRANNALYVHQPHIPKKPPDHSREKPICYHSPVETTATARVQHKEVLAFIQNLTAKRSYLTALIADNRGVLHEDIYGYENLHNSIKHCTIRSFQLCLVTRVVNGLYHTSFLKQSSTFDLS